jgi:hypothetical protein
MGNPKPVSEMTAEERAALIAEMRAFDEQLARESRGREPSDRERRRAAAECDPTEPMRPSDRFKDER